MKVLFVDDEADIRELIDISLMDDDDIETTFAATGAEAIEILKVQDFDVMVLDVMMLPPDGKEVLHVARCLPRHAQTKIVMCTAQTSKEAETELLGLGANQVLHKPFKTVKLSKYLRAL